MFCPISEMLEMYVFPFIPVVINNGFKLLYNVLDVYDSSAGDITNLTLP